MVLMEPLTLSIVVVFKKTFGQLLLEEIVGYDELQEKIVYIRLKKIKSNGVSDWFRKESM